MAKKIYLIDDDQDIVESTKILLEATGYDVKTAYSIESGKKLFETGNPDLVLLDVMFPEQQDAGFEFCRDLRTNDKTKAIPVIMFTAVNDKFPFHFDTDAEFLPADVMLNKPVEPKELLAKIAGLIQIATSISS